MKAIRKFLAVVLPVILFCITPICTQAEEGYTYTVRFYAGGQGYFQEGEVVTYTGLEYGERVTFNQNMITLKDGSKYYVKGIRESGRDNNTANAVSFLVTGDRDYVVAYVLLANAVAYTVRYEDNQGRALAPEETYYGNVGDKPVIAFLYVEGYQPQAYNLTKTLSENKAENVFVFVYSPIPESSVDEPGTGDPNPGDSQNEGDQNQTPGGNQNTGDQNQAPGGNQNTGDQNQAPGEDQNTGDQNQNPGEDQNTGDQNQNPGEDENQGGNQTEDDTQVEEPREIDDLDLPQAQFPDNTKETGGIPQEVSASPVKIGAALAVVVLAALAFCYVIIVRRKRQGKDED